jgi:hypothetical protein
MYSLEVGCRVRACAGVVVLVEVRLERCGTGTVLRLVAKGSTGVEVQIVVVGSHLVLALLHAPENKGNTTEKECAADAANDTSDDLLVALAQAARVVVVGLRCWRVGKGGFASCDWDRVCACERTLDNSSITASGCDDACKGLKRSRHKSAGPNNGRRTGRRGWRFARLGRCVA